MAVRLRLRNIELPGRCYLRLEPDEDKQRYLVRFCGLNRDRAAIAATESVRVKLLLAHRRGQCADPYPLPERITIGWLDRHGWHVGRSPYAAALAELPVVHSCLERLINDLVLRVALAAFPPAKQTRSTSHN